MLVNNGVFIKTAKTQKVSYENLKHSRIQSEDRGMQMPSENLAVDIILLFYSHLNKVVENLPQHRQQAHHTKIKKNKTVWVAHLVEGLPFI